MNLQSGLVSIIMPVFNGQHYLAEAIDSVRAQQYNRWELIVIDDGSTDDTALIVKHYDDPRIRYFYQSNSGQTAALNAGLRHARGEFITTLDADDNFPPDSIQARVDHLQQHPHRGAVYGDGQYCEPSGTPLRLFSEQMPLGATDDVYDLLIVSPFYGTGANVIIRHNVLLDSDIQYDESIAWCQDWDFYIRVAACTMFGFVETSTINYRIHGDSMTVSMAEQKRLESLIRMRHKILKSQRFKKTENGLKLQFLYDFLVTNLSEHVKAQDEILRSNIVQGLPPRQQSFLWRQAALTQLTNRRQAAPSTVRARLWQAWKLFPLDPKTPLALFLTVAHIPTARRVISSWQQTKQGAGPKSPFEDLLAKNAN